MKKHLIVLTALAILNIAAFLFNFSSDSLPNRMVGIVNLFIALGLIIYILTIINKNRPRGYE